MNVDHFFPKFGARFSTNARTASVWSPCSDAQVAGQRNRPPGTGRRRKTRTRCRGTDR